jgi:hypothetical protein
MDDLDLATVAARLGKSKSWLQNKLTEDRRGPKPRLQHHHYIGRTPQWDEREYQALKAALMRKPDAQPQMLPSAPEPKDRDGERLASSLSSDTASSSSLTPSELRKALAASARVQALPLRPRTKAKPTNRPGKKSKNS